MKKMIIPVAEPNLGREELNNVVKAVKSGWVSSGEYILKFEKEFAKYIGVKYAAAVSNGTTGLHLALLASGIKKGDEIIVPDLTYVATANAAAYIGAKPVMVDVEPDYWCIKPEAILKAITKKTKAIIPVHLYGNAAEMKEILKIAKKHRLLIIEDAAEAHGAVYYGKRAGNLGNAGVFSFFGNKIITAGEGGMITTNDKKIYERVKLLRNQAQDPKNKYWHPEIGFNYRITNLQAAVGCAQIKKLNSFIDKKRQIFQWYKKYLKDLKDITLNSERENTKSVYWMISIVLGNGVSRKISRDTLRNLLEKDGIETRPFFSPLSKLPMYRKERHLSNLTAYNLSKNGLNLPSSTTLTESNVKFVCQALKKHLL